VSWRLPALCLAVLLAGCSFDVTQCTSDEDCPTGAACGRPAGTDYAVCIAPGEADADDAIDATFGEPDAPLDDPDEGTAPAPDMREQVPAECDAPTNCRTTGTASFPALLNESAAGCPFREFEPFDVREHGFVCRGKYDHYVVEYVRCESASFRIEIVLDVGPQCLDNATLELWDDDLRCGQPDVRCEVRGDGTQRISIIVGPSDFATPVEDVEFAIAGEEGGGAEYDLRVHVSR